jgi:hypothetical protein
MHNVAAITTIQNSNSADPNVTLVAIHNDRAICVTAGMAQVAIHRPVNVGVKRVVPAIRTNIGTEPVAIEQSFEFRHPTPNETGRGADVG